jgi:hypothetical protein
MAEIERTQERISSNNGADVNRASGRVRRSAPAPNAAPPRRGGGQQRSNGAASGPAGRGRRSRGGGEGARGGGSRKAEARAGNADFFYEGDFSPSSGSEPEYPHDYHGAPPSSPASRGGSSPQQQHRFNVNAPSFRPSPPSAAPVSLSASAPASSAYPLPHEVRSSDDVVALVS